jgi:hypothetical protein
LAARPSEKCFSQAIGEGQNQTLHLPQTDAKRSREPRSQTWKKIHSVEGSIVDESV